MMQPDTQLLETLLGVARVAALDADRRAAADVIAEIGAVEDLLHAEERQQRRIERTRGLEPVHRQHDMGHPVEFDHVSSDPSRRP